jgi:hypothetical protein
VPDGLGEEDPAAPRPEPYRPAPAAAPSAAPQETAAAPIDPYPPVGAAGSLPAQDAAPRTALSSPAPSPHTAASGAPQAGSAPGSGEVHGLTSALTYTQAMADTMSDGVTSLEAALSALTAAGVTGAVVIFLVRGQENLLTAADSFQAAHSELAGHLIITDAYHANPGAGTREFVTSD